MLAVLAFFGDWYLSRPSRVRLARERERLLELRDAILEFKLDRERFPRDLDELVPAYVGEAMTVCRPGVGAAKRKVLWDAREGVLSWPGTFEIRGLFRRTVALRTDVQDRPVRRDPLVGRNVFGRRGQQIPLGEEDIVVEAELFQFMTYGWEIGEREGASGNCYIHIKEGAGDLGEAGIVFDPAVRAGDFYNVTRDRRHIEARCYFMAPQEAAYFVTVRTMAHRSHCSNIINLTVNEGGPVQVGRNGTEPFVWLWHRVGKAHLKEGLNRVSFFTCQDDVKVDQVILTTEDPALSEDSQTTFRGGHREPVALPADIGPLTLSLSANTLRVVAEENPAVQVHVTKHAPRDISAKLRISLDLPGDRRRERAYDIRLGSSQALTRFQCPVDLPRPLERKEYLLRCQLMLPSEVVQERTLVLFHGYDWLILGPLPFMAAASRGEPEGDKRLKSKYSFAGKEFSWQRYDHRHTGHFCIMDFGKVFSGRTYHAMENAAVYAYTEVDAKEAGEYLLKSQGDDDLVVWINGDKAVTITDGETPIRSARETKVSLRRGVNRILLRLNQRKGQWQAGIRIRTAADQVADVLGIPFAQQGYRLSRTSSQ